MRERRVPAATLALVVAAIAVALVPALQRWLVLDREAVAAGELWRVATGSLVHFSPSHLAFDLVAVAIPGWVMERGGRRIGGIVALSLVAVGVAVLVAAPGIESYGGLSGVAYTLVVLCALDASEAPGRGRAVSVALLALIAAKLSWEMRSGAFLFVSDAGTGVIPVPVSHLAGSAVGVAAHVWRKARAAPARILARGVESRA